MNEVRREAQRGAKQSPRRAIVSAYDPDHYCAKVRIMPEDFETGFLPIGSTMVGNGWGMLCGPSIGDEVDVHFQEGGRNAAYISLRFFGNKAQPPRVESGEFLLLHASGAAVHLPNDGTLKLKDSAGAVLTLNADNSATLTANLRVVGDIVATGDISDHDGTRGTVQGIRTIYDEHTHNAPGGTTDIPNQQL